MKKCLIMCLVISIVFAYISVNAQAPAPEITFSNITDGEQMEITGSKPVKAVVTSDTPVETVALFLNGTKVAAQVGIVGDEYCFSDYLDDWKELGIVEFKVTVADVNGNVGEDTVTIKIINVYKNEIQNTLTFTDRLTKKENFSSTANNGSAVTVVDTLDKNGAATEAWVIQATSNVASNGFGAITLSGGGEYQVKADVRFSAATTLQISIHWSGGSSILASIKNELQVNLYNGATSYVGGTLQKKQDGTDAWYSLELGFDTATQKYTLSIDGNLLTPEGGNTPQNALGDIQSIRLQFQNIKDSNYGNLDNVSCTKFITLPYIESVANNGKEITVKLSDGIISENIKDNIKLYCFGNEYEIDSCSYDAVSKTVSVTTKNAPHTAVEHKIIFSENVKSSGGNAIGYPNANYFITKAAPFDVTSFYYVKEDGRIGAQATIKNNLTEEKSIVMVMVFKNTDGAVEKVCSSEVELVEPNGTENLEIIPIESEGRTPEVFFLNDWASCLGVKTFIYK